MKALKHNSSTDDDIIWGVERFGMIIPASGDIGLEDLYPDDVTIEDISFSLGNENLVSYDLVKVGIREINH